MKGHHRLEQNTRIVAIIMTLAFVGGVLGLCAWSSSAVKDVDRIGSRTRIVSNELTMSSIFDHPRRVAD